MNNNFTIEDMKKLIDKVNSFTSYFGEQEIEYLCLISEKLPINIIDGLKCYRNVEVKVVNPAYLPDKNSIYYIPKDTQFGE